MSEYLAKAAIALSKRESATVVSATGLFFHALGRNSPTMPLNDVVLSHKGGIWGEESVPSIGYPILRSSDMRGKKVDVSGAVWCALPETNIEQFAMQSGDILITKSSGSSDLVGKAALFTDPQDGNTYLFSNFTLRLRPDTNRVLPEYLAWFLRSPQSSAWRYETQQTTVGLRNLQTREYLEQALPVPDRSIQKIIVEYLNAIDSGYPDASKLKLPMSLTEQQRIVARVEELARRVEEARGLRREAAEEAEALVSSYLSSLVSELESKFEVRSLEDLLIEAGYGTSVKCTSTREKDTIPVLRIPNVASEKVAFGDLKYGGLNEAEKKKATLQEGDILVVRTNGSADLVGRCAVVPSLPEAMAFASYMIRLRCDRQIIDPYFLQLVLRQQRTGGFLIDFARTTAGQYNVSLGRLRNTRIPIPSLDEQRRIVAYLDGLQAKVDKLRRLQAETQKELDALMPSILAKAFAGEL